MNRYYSFLLLLSLAGVSPLWAQAPADIANKTIRLDMSRAQVSRSDFQQKPLLPWYQLDDITDFVIDFPDTSEFTDTVKYGNELSSVVQVSYSAPAGNQAIVTLGGKDFSVQVELSYASATAGTATIAWHEAGDTRHFRNVTFRVQDDLDVESRIEFPEEIISTSPDMWDDGLQAILSEIENANYRSATDKLYQKRLVSLLPMVMMTHNGSFTNPDYKGNTALHYACGLSHVELVQWLVEHGADLEARTDNGASIDACISGRNAEQIRAILRAAREWRDRPYTGPEVDEQAAREAAGWLEVEFSGYNQESPDYAIPTDDQKARESAQLLYRCVKSGTGPFGLGMCMTDTPAILLTRVLNAKVSEAMFVEDMLRELKQSYKYQQHVRRKDGLVLARLPHMILAREEEGMTPDAATSIYRAACEGNVELVAWLLEHGADTRLVDKQGNIVTELKNVPNEAAIRNMLKWYVAPAQVAGKKFTYHPANGGPALHASWQGMNEETEGSVKEDEDWIIIKTAYTRTGPASAIVTRQAEWSPGGHYAAGWTNYEFKLKFTSPTQGTATCTSTTKFSEPTTTTGTFILK